MDSTTFRREFEKTLWIYLNLTLECNRMNESRPCDHCYLNNRKTLANEVIDEKTIERLVWVYVEHVKKYGESKYNKFKIFGGEPFLYPDILKKVALKFREASSKISISVFTNGDLLTEEILAWLKDKGITIIYSVNDDDVELVKERLSLIKKFGKLNFIVIVLCDKNLRRLKDLLRLAYESNIRKVEINNDFIDVGKDHLKLCEEIIPEVMQWLLDENMIFKPEAFYNLFTLKNKKEFYNTCGSNLITIDPDGSVLACECTGNKIGNIWDENFDFIELRKVCGSRLIWNYNGIAECEACEFKLICGGDCPLRRMLAYGRADVPSPLCSVNKKVIPLLLEMKRRWENIGF
jgi:radical SAM protein with 4Fe4S-binding SPASM domain